MVATDPLSASAARRDRSGPQGRAAAANKSWVNNIGQAQLAWPVKLYLLALVIPIAFYAGPLYLNSLRVVLLITIIPMVFQLLAGKMGKIILTDVFFFLYIAWNTLSTAVNNPEDVVQNVGSTSVEFIGGYLIARRYIQTRENFIAMCKWIAALAALTLPFAIAETLTGNPHIISFIRSLPGLTSEVPVYIEKRMGLERVQLVFAHPIHYGLFCSIAFSLTFVAMQDIISDMRRYVVSAIVVVCTFLALSSGALLAVMLQFGMITWYMLFRNTPKKWFLLLCLFAVMYVVIDLLSTRTPLRVFMSYATFSSHNAYWRGIIFEWGIKNIFGDASENVVGSPIFGIGLNDWVRPHFMHSGSMDNFWLVIGVRNGVPGFLFLAVGYVFVLYQVAKRNFDSDIGLTQLRRAWLFSFMGLTFTLCTVHIWTAVFSFVFFLFGAGVWFMNTTPDDGAGEADEGPSGRPTNQYTRFKKPSGGGKPAPQTTQDTSRQRNNYSRFKTKSP